MQKVITIPDIGMVSITKKSNATRIKLRVHPNKGILVTIPHNLKFKIGEEFVYKNLEWLKDKLKNIREKKQQDIFTPESIFITRKSSVKFIPFDSENLKAKFDGQNISFYYNPSLIDFSDKGIQDFITKFIVRSLKIEASDYLINRAYHLSDRTKIKFNKISIGTASTRWGSCSSCNDIILSCRLILLPDELINYVILHELCHVLYKNHGIMFHSLLDKLVNGRSKELNNLLKKHSTEPVPGDYRFLK